MEYIRDMDKRKRHFKVSNFFKGFWSGFDMTGYIPVPDLSNGPRRDRDAIYEDWTKVGNDIRSAMNMVKNG
jgi:hypothetical protein